MGELPTHTLVIFYHHSNYNTTAVKMQDFVENFLLFNFCTFCLFFYQETLVLTAFASRLLIRRRFKCTSLSLYIAMSSPFGVIFRIHLHTADTDCRLLFDRNFFQHKTQEISIYALQDNLFFLTDQ